MDDNQTSESTATAKAPVSFSGKVCLTISIGLLLAGFCVATGLLAKIMPFVSFIGAHSLETLGAVAACGGLVLVGYLYLKSNVAMHIFNNLALLLLFCLLSYVLAIEVDYKGETVLNIWGLIILEIGLIAFSFCFIRHYGGVVRDFSWLMGMGQGAFVFLLFICLGISNDQTRLAHIAEARAAFNDLHGGKISTSVEPFEYKGATFKCSMIGGTADCSYSKR